MEMMIIMLSPVFALALFLFLPFYTNITIKIYRYFRNNNARCIENQKKPAW